MTRTLALPIDMRALIGSGPNAENRGENTASVLQGAESGEVEFRYPAEQRKDPVSLADSVSGQDVGKPVGCRAQLGIAVIADASSRPIQRRASLSPRAGRVPVDGLVCDVEPAAGQTIELCSRLRPRKGTDILFVIWKTGAETLLRLLADSLPFHCRPSLSGFSSGRF